MLGGCLKGVGRLSRRCVVGSVEGVKDCLEGVERSPGWCREVVWKVRDDFP